MLGTKVTEMRPEASSVMVCHWMLISSYTEATGWAPKEIRKGSPNCWLNFSECSELKTESNGLNLKGPSRYFILWICQCWGLVHSSLSFFSLAVYSFLRKYNHFLGAYCVPGTVLTLYQPITLPCTLLIRRPRPSNLAKVTSFSCLLLQSRYLK